MRLVTSAFPAVPSTKHHIELPKTSYLSKHFVAYIEALVGAAPYFRPGTTDPRMKLDARFAKAFSEFNKQDDLCFDQCVARKLRAWFARFPPTQRVAATVDDENTEGGPGGQGEAGVAGEEEEEEEDYALSRGE